MVRILVTLTLVFLSTACASAPASAPVAAAPAAVSTTDLSHYDQLVIVGTNDFHGYLRPVEAALSGEKVVLGGAEWFAGHVRILEKKFGDRLILLDAGDMFQGTMESNLFLGKSVVDFYNELPYRAAAIGNHEFDYGDVKRSGPDRLGALKARLRQAKFPFVQANIFIAGTDRPWREANLTPSALFQAGGYKVGVIGLTTTSTPAKTLPLNVRQLEFRDFVQPTIKEARALRARGADIVIALAHEGGEKPGDPINEFLRELPPGTVDAAVTGHTHTEIHQLVHGVPVIQSKTRGLFFGRIDLFVNKATRKLEPSLTKLQPMHWICGTWFKNEEQCDHKGARDHIAAGTTKVADYLPLRKVTYEGEEVVPDARVREVLAPYFKKTDERKTEVLAQVSRDFDAYPSGETEMGDLWIRAFRWKFPKARVAYLNGGGFRRRFYKGPLTYGDLFEVHPFDNFAVEVRMNGKQLKDLIRVGVSGSNAIPSLYGLKVTYHGGQNPAYQRDVNGDGVNEAWEEDRLASLTWEDTGKPVEDNEEFWLATNDYLVAGGDSLRHVFGSIPMSKRNYLDITQRDVAAEYLRANRGLSLPLKEKSRIEKIE